VCCIDVSMGKIPFNTIPVFGEDGKELDDTGKRVIVNSVGGALRNVKGVVLYGPHIYWFKANCKKKAKNPKGYILVPEIFKTQPSWRIRLDGYLLDIAFVASELTFE
jgi:hypothetical protein